MLSFRNIVLGALCGSGVYSLAINDWDLNSLGPVRFGRAAAMAGAIFYDYRFNVYENQKFIEDKSELNEIWSQAHKRSAERILELCRANRGAYIKVGQHLGALDYLLPPEYINTLRILHSQAPLSTLEEVRQVIKEELNISQEDIFYDWDPEPIGAASLAQVYKAKLKTNDELVAVKVQHAKVKARSYVDMKTMEILVKIADWAFPDFKLLWLAEETKKNLPIELNFVQEGKNADKLKELLKEYKWLKIPKIHWNYCSPKVLVMDFCEGGQVNDIKYLQDHSINPKEVASKLGTLYSEMIFHHGYVHCDPHPGNILVRKSHDNQVELALIDHGLYTTLSDEFRVAYSKLWLSIIHSDTEGIKKHGEEIGVGELYGLFACMVAARSWESITNTKKGGITKNEITSDEEHIIRRNVGNYLPQISEILDRVPRPMVLIFKTNDLIRGVEHAIGTQKTMKSFTTMSKFCVRAVFHDRMLRCSDLWCYLKNQLLQQYSLTKIRLAEVCLQLKSLVLLIVGADPYY